MSIEPAASSGQPERGLPPVRPPSGRFIVQLFVVPGLIVAVAVLILWGFSWLAGGTASREKFMEGLRSSNADIRWRTAHELAQVLLRDRKEPEPKLAADVNFALELTDLLHNTLTNEADLLDRLKKLSKNEADNAEAIAKAKKELTEERKLIDFLCQCLANFDIPVGAPVLCQVAVSEEGGNTQEVALRRQQAVWSLANLGENIKAFDKLSAAQRDQVLGDLDREAKGAGRRAEWARETLAFLNKQSTLNVDKALAKCARSDDQNLRKLVALALNFWNGPDVEPTLLLLAQDRGHGTPVTDAEAEPKR
jgi:hypothetical protein